MYYIKKNFCKLLKGERLVEIKINGLSQVGVIR